MSAPASPSLASPSPPPAQPADSTRAETTAAHFPQPAQRPQPSKRRAPDDEGEAASPGEPAGTGAADLPPVVSPQDAAGLTHHEGHEAMIEANDDDHSVESDEFEPEEWEEGSSNASTSICSSVYNHTYENGRRYHSYKHGRYPIPNDDLEQNREDMKHAMMLELTDGKLCYAPIGDHPQQILDIGTGTGIWAIEAGDRYPSASVLGIDLSPIQPLWLPPNVKFIIDDCEDEWLNGSNWDLVHLRTMSPILKDVPKLCRQAFQNIKPGGWIEFQEMQCWMLCDDGTMATDDPAFEFYKLVYQAFKRLGFDTTLCSRLGDTLRDAGFTNINCVIRKVPVGRWPRDRRLRLVGHYLKIAIQELLPALCGKPLSLLGLNEVERELWRTATSRALDDESVHRYWYFYFWYAQKPE